MRKKIGFVAVILVFSFFTSCEGLCRQINELLVLAQVAQYAPELVGEMTGALETFSTSGTLPDGVDVAGPVTDADGNEVYTVNFDSYTTESDKSYQGSISYVTDPDGNTTVTTDGTPLVITDAEGTEVELEVDIEFDENGEVSGGTMSIGDEEVDFATYYQALVDKGYIDSFSL
ncbi:MAG: hypothetical protein JXR63_06080 [Spirochaetales bacterium]|nr:hypothetical protein [Spirochaetales bacterium]